MITIDWQNKIVESTASILDLPVFHAALRDLEDSEAGAIHDVTHTWKALDQGGGAFMYQADLINGYHLKFPVAGNYEISGNLKGVIDPVAGVYVERQTSTAYITTAQGGSGPTAESIAAAVLAAMAVSPPPVNVRSMNGAPIIGTGLVGDDWRGVGVQPQ